jgi:hypothetical protein
MLLYRRTHGVKAPYKPSKRIDKEEVPPEKQWKIKGGKGGRPNRKERIENLTEAEARIRQKIEELKKAAEEVRRQRKIEESARDAEGGDS